MVSKTVRWNPAVPIFLRALRHAITRLPNCTALDCLEDQLAGTPWSELSGPICESFQQEIKNENRLH